MFLVTYVTLVKSAEGNTPSSTPSRARWLDWSTSSTMKLLVI